MGLAYRKRLFDSAELLFTNRRPANFHIPGRGGVVYEGDDRVRYHSLSYFHRPLSTPYAWKSKAKVGMWKYGTAFETPGQYRKRTKVSSETADGALEEDEEAESWFDVRRRACLEDASWDVYVGLTRQIRTAEKSIAPIFHLMSDSSRRSSQLDRSGSSITPINVVFVLTTLQGAISCRDINGKLMGHHCPVPLAFGSIPF